MMYRMNQEDTAHD